jgi:MFS family permease
MVRRGKLEGAFKLSDDGRDKFMSLTADGWLLFATRFARLFAYGFLSVVLILFLKDVGLDETQIGLLLTLTLLGDTAVSLWITTTADRRGRRRMLMAGGWLMVFAAVLFAATDNFWLLLLAATIGVISPSGTEVGPFLSIEQAALSHIVPDDSRTSVFAWYNLVGSVATAVGSLCGGLLTQWLQDLGFAGAAAGCSGRYPPPLSWVPFGHERRSLGCGTSALGSARRVGRLFPRLQKESARVGLHRLPLVFHPVHGDAGLPGRDVRCGAAAGGSCHAEMMVKPANPISTNPAANFTRLASSRTACAPVSHPKAEAGL